MHNKLVIKKGNKVYLSYNNMLPCVAEDIANFRAYSVYLAIGRGASATTSQMEKLESYTNTIKLVTDSYNFDPLLGQMFLKKKLVLDESNSLALEIVEVGLTSDGEGDNPSIVNRFVVNGGEPIYRDAGEEMSFEVTIYFDFDEASTLKLTGGSNNFVKLMLGEEFDEDISFYLGKSKNLTKNDTIIDRSDFDENVYPAEIEVSYSKEAKTVNFIIKGALGKGVVEELLVLLNGDVVMRANANELFGFNGEESVWTAAVDNDLSVVLNVPAIATIGCVNDDTAGAEVAEYKTKYFGTSFGEIVYNPFGSDSFLADYGRAVSKEGDRIIFFDYDADVKYVYAFDGETFTKRDISQMSVKGGYMTKIIRDIVFVKACNDGAYSLYPYYYENGVYKKKSCYISSSSFDDVGVNGNWKTMDVGNSNYGEEYMTLLVDTGMTIFCNRIYVGSQNNIYRNTYCSALSENGVGHSLLMDYTNRGDVTIVGYDTAKNFIYVKEFPALMEKDKSEQAVEFGTRVYDEGYPKVGKNYYYGAKAQDGKIYFYNVYDKTFHEFYYENAKKFWSSPNLDYIVVEFLDNTFKFYYVDGSLNQYEFSSGLPDEINGADVRDLDFVKGGLILFMADGSNILLKINEERMVLSAFSADSTISITYTADTTPGISGSIVQAIGEVQIDC